MKKTEQIRYYEGWIRRCRNAFILGAWSFGLMNVITLLAAFTPGLVREIMPFYMLNGIIVLLAMYTGILSQIKRKIIIRKLKEHAYCANCRHFISDIACGRNPDIIPEGIARCQHFEFYYWFNPYRE